MPSVPPEQDCAAARAESRSSGVMVLLVQGVSRLVAASQRQKYALKERWSTLQLPWVLGGLRSQPASNMMVLLESVLFGPVKKASEDLRKPVLGVCQYWLASCQIHKTKCLRSHLQCGCARLLGSVPWSNGDQFVLRLLWRCLGSYLIPHHC